MTADTLIIGGGLSGLYTAHLLNERGKSFRVIEAGAELGGRIRTVQRQRTPIELGPSWFWPDNNPRLARFVRQIGLPTFAQHTEGDVILDDGNALRRQSHRLADPRLSLRLTNGSRSLVDALLSTLPADWLLPRHRVTTITHQPGGIIVNVATAEGERVLSAIHVIVALPLRLAAASIDFEPELPLSVMTAFQNTPTWMAGEAKFFALYERPFWRDVGLTGTMMSATGPLAESHDASHPNGVAALLGFLNLGPEERQSLGQALVPACLAQLTRYFGAQAESPIDTFLMDWSTESLTATASDGPLNQHPQYGIPKEAEALWNNQLQFAGTESASEHGGYLEGALAAAERAVHALSNMAPCVHLG